MEKRKTNITFLIILTLIALLLISIFFVQSKYTGKLTGDSVQIASEFYLESDQLTVSGNSDSPYNLYNWNPTEAYTFTISLRNWQDQLRISGVSYTVDLTSDVSGITFSTNPVTFTAPTNPPTAGTLTNTDITVTIPANTTLTDNKLTITATADDNYYKQMSATFNMNRTQDPAAMMSAKNCGTYVSLLINMTNDVNYTITWPASLSPDNTNPLLVNARNTTRSITISGTGNFEQLNFFVTGNLSSTDKFTVNGTEVSIS